MPRFFYQIVTGLKCAFAVQKPLFMRFDEEYMDRKSNETLTAFSLATPLKCHTFAALNLAVITNSSA